MSRELTIAWVKRNCPDPRVLKDVSGRLDQAAASGFLLLVFGNRLTKSRSPYLVVSHYSEMFAFELTSRQLKNMGVPPDVLGAVIRKWNSAASSGFSVPPVLKPSGVNRSARSSGVVNSASVLICAISPKCLRFISDKVRLQAESAGRWGVAPLFQFAHGNIWRSFGVSTAVCSARRRVSGMA